MKKSIYIIAFIVVIALTVGAYVGVTIINSPEYALIQIANDVEKFGVDGLMPHLTDEAQETIFAITSITESDFVNSIFSLLEKDDYTGILKSNLKEVKWSLDDVLKGKEKADVVLRFNYKDKLVGTIDLKMVYLESSWKIKSIDMPRFERISFEN